MTGREDRRVLVQREMRARAHVVATYVREYPVQPRRVHHDDVIEALTSDRADDAFHVGVLPRRSRRCANRLDVHPGDSGRDVCKDRIAIVEEIPRRLVLRKGVAKLLCGPGRRRMLGDRHVDDSSTVVREDDEHEEQPERDRRHDEEVGGHDLARVIREKGSPRL